MSNFKFSNLNFNENFKLKIKNSTPVFPILTELSSPQQHFEFGRQIIQQVPTKTRVGWIASGDMSHRLTKDGPYGLHPSGPKFDKLFIELLKRKDIGQIINLPERLVEEAGECGLRSFCCLLGALEALRASWSPEILSYEGPFGVGYLVARLL
jgi:aromatic ring-opening dioxygenase LigB subunit